MLGIFTRQGAQWPGMLKKLMLGIPYTARIIEELDEALRTLPERYRPSWTLQDQLMMLEGEASNIRQANYSQPLCCAVQVVLFRLLSAAGIQFNAVVGRSSGEIARAFAAGFISAAPAIGPPTFTALYPPTTHLRRAGKLVPCKWQARCTMMRRSFAKWRPLKAESMLQPATRPTV